MKQYKEDVDKYEHLKKNKKDKKNKEQQVLNIYYFRFNLNSNNFKDDGFDECLPGTSPPSQK
jgi:hypothetical protein